MKAAFWEEIRFETAGVVGRGLLGSLFATVRCRREGAEHLTELRKEGSPVIFVFWHGRLLPLAHYHGNEGIVVLVSEHADGEYIARIIQHYGFGTVRGSSTRGGVRGLKGLVRQARKGRDLGITPDGPQGPAGEVKMGVLAAARLTGLPLVPVSAGASRAWSLPSWDRFLVPKPFSRVRIAYGPPRWVPRDATDDRLVREADALQRELDRLTAAVDGGFAEPVASSDPGGHRS